MPPMPPTSCSSCYILPGCAVHVMVLPRATCLVPGSLPAGRNMVHTTMSLIQVATLCKAPSNDMLAPSKGAIGAS